MKRRFGKRSSCLWANRTSMFDEIQKTNQWLDKWINGTTEEDDEVGLPETSRSRRIGMVQDLSDWAKDISPLLVSSTLGIDLGNRGEAGELEVPSSVHVRPDSSLMLFAKQARHEVHRHTKSALTGSWCDTVMGPAAEEEEPEDSRNQEQAGSDVFVGRNSSLAAELTGDALVERLRHGCCRS
ncbi:unnamed protein product [Symbiodinium sp. CCMP2592]|nr:unnamed protein product [Symbiodinium sp. CCMP2592]